MNFCSLWLLCCVLASARELCQTAKPPQPIPIHTHSLWGDLNYCPKWISGDCSMSLTHSQFGFQQPPNSDEACLMRPAPGTAVGLGSPPEPPSSLQHCPPRPPEARALPQPHGCGAWAGAEPPPAPAQPALSCAASTCPACAFWALPHGNCWGERLRGPGHAACTSSEGSSAAVNCNPIVQQNRRGIKMRLHIHPCLLHQAGSNSQAVCAKGK